MDLIGKLVVEQAVVVPSKHNAEPTNTKDYQYRNVRLATFHGVVREECEFIKNDFIEHNSHIDKRALHFTFECKDYL